MAAASSNRPSCSSSSANSRNASASAGSGGCSARKPANVCQRQIATTQAQFGARKIPSSERTSRLRRVSAPPSQLMPRRLLLLGIELIELGKDCRQIGVTRLMFDEILQEIVPARRRAVLPMRFRDGKERCHEDGVGRALRLFQDGSKQARSPFRFRPRIISIRPRKNRRSFLSAAEIGWKALSNFVAPAESPLPRTAQSNAAPRGVASVLHSSVGASVRSASCGFPSARNASA